MMRNKILIALICCFGLIGSAQAQLAFWNYDDEGREAAIPPECDGTFDETSGLISVPTPDELFEKGEAFLLSANPIERNKAGYCLIGAALSGNVNAQYRVAQLYNKGVVLPQDELSAYRWAFIASLNGHEEANRLALLLERFMTTEDIQIATASISELLPNIEARYRQELDDASVIVSAKQEELDKINAEIDKMLGIKTDIVTPKTPTSEKSIVPAGTSGAIFSEADRLE
jgi:hypothetical protein